MPGQMKAQEQRPYNQIYNLQQWGERELLS